MVTIWGKVTTGRGADWFYVDDGSGVEDGTRILGVFVSASSIPDIPDGGSYAQVTGISSCEFYQGKLVNVLLLRMQEDIVVLRQVEGALRSLESGGATNPRELSR